MQREPSQTRTWTLTVRNMMAPNLQEELSYILLEAVWGLLGTIMVYSGPTGDHRGS